MTPFSLNTARHAWVSGFCHTVMTGYRPNAFMILFKYFTFVLNFSLISLNKQTVTVAIKEIVPLWANKSGQLVFGVA